MGTPDPGMNDRALARLAERVEVAGLTDLFAAAPRDLAADLGLSIAPAADGIAIRADGLPGFIFNRAVGFGFDAPLDEPALDRIIEFYRGAAQFSIQPCPFASPREIPRWLEARGHHAYVHWVKWVRSTDSPPAASTDLRIERIPPEHASHFAELAGRTFQMERAAAWLARVVGRPRWTHYVVYDAETPVGAATLFVDGEAGNLLSAATLESHRGRGIQSALIARRIHDAARAGCRWVVVETAEDRPDKPAPSYRNQSRAGFRILYRRPSHVWPKPVKA